MANTTTEQRKELAKLRVISEASRESMRAGGRKGVAIANAGRTAEQRSELGKKARAAQKFNAEANSIRMKNQQASLTAEQKRDIARKGAIASNLSTSPEQKRASGKRLTSNKTYEEMRQSALHMVSVRMLNRKAKQRSLDQLPLPFDDI